MANYGGLTWRIVALRQPLNKPAWRYHSRPVVDGVIASAPTNLRRHREAKLILLRLGGWREASSIRGDNRPISESQAAVVRMRVASASIRHDSRMPIRPPLTRHSLTSSAASVSASISPLTKITTPQLRRIEPHIGGRA